MARNNTAKRDKQPSAKHTQQLSPNAAAVHNKILAVLSHDNQPNSFRVLDACYKTVLRLTAQQKNDKVLDFLEIIKYYGSSIRPTPLMEEAFAATVTIHTKETLQALHHVPKDQLEFLRVFQSLKEVQQFLGQSSEEPKSPSVASQPLTPPELLAMEDPTPSNILHCLKATKNIAPHDLHSVISLVPSESNHLLDILTLFFMHYRRYCAIERSAMRTPAHLELTPHIVSLITSVVLDSSHPENVIESFVSLFSTMLIPDFIPMIRAISDAFMSESRFIVLLKNILGYLGYATFTGIIDPIDFERYQIILRSISNADISDFLSLYELYSDRPNELACIIPLMPGFCNYGSDHHGSIYKLLGVMNELLPSHCNIVCNALERLVRSHYINLTSNTVLSNPIGKETSQAILAAVKDSNIADGVAAQFVRRSNNECDGALQVLAEICGFDMSSMLVEDILRPGCARLYESLSLLVFFAHNVQYSFELVSSLVAHCSSNDVRVQKKAYQVLDTLIAKGIPVCICEMLFTSKTISAEGNYSKNRLSLLLKLLKGACSQCKLSDIRTKIFRELAASLGSGNAKCRKLARETFKALAGNAQIHNWILDALKNENEEQATLKGLLYASGTIIEHANLAKSCLSNNLIECESFASEVVEAIQFVCFSSAELIRAAMETLNTILGIPELNKLSSTVIGIVSKCAKLNNKFKNDYKACAYTAMKMGYKLTPELHFIMKLKNSGGVPKEIQVLRNK